jgi:hypothetical protein
VLPEPGNRDSARAATRPRVDDREPVERDGPNSRTARGPDAPRSPQRGRGEAGGGQAQEGTAAGLHGHVLLCPRSTLSPDRGPAFPGKRAAPVRDLPTVRRASEDLWVATIKSGDFPQTVCLSPAEGSGDSGRSLFGCAPPVILPGC